MGSKRFPIDLDGRQRDQDGQIHQKRSDTKVETLRKEYGSDFAKGFRSDAHLGTVRDATGKSLHDLIKNTKNK
jgi:hypothetical protein